MLGTPEEIRTPDLWYRKPTLYPAELRVHSLDKRIFVCPLCGAYTILVSMRRQNGSHFVGLLFSLGCKGGNVTYSNRLGDGYHYLLVDTPEAKPL